MASPADTVILDDNELDQFALLRPWNIEACLAFSDIIERIINNDPLLHHHRQFIEYESMRVPLQQAMSISRQLNNSGEFENSFDTETETESDWGNKSEGDRGQRDVYVWTGGYVLSLGCLPHLPSIGWQVGSGRWKVGTTNLDPCGGVDILLTGDSRRAAVRGIHARMAFNRQTGLLMLQARHSEPYGVRLDNESFALQSRSLNARSSIVRFGKLEYIFAYTVQPNSGSEKLFQLQKQKFFREHLQAPPPIEATSATPSQNDLVLGNWTLKRAVGRGAFGTVLAATHRNGAVVAFKTFMRYDSRSDRFAQLEIAAAEQLKPFLLEFDRKRHIIRLEEVIYQRGRREYDGSGPENIWMLYSPLARGTFQNHILERDSNTINETVRAILFKQVLEGLDCLHAHGWVHRDIKPLNLGVVSIEPPKAVILDIGSVALLEPGEVGFRPRPGAYGTVSYLAPEMELATYHAPVDIWALGLVAHEIFLGSHPWKLAVNPWRTDKNRYYTQYLNIYTDTIQKLRSAGSGTIHDLIAKMLAWEPRARISSRSALEHPCLRGISTGDANWTPSSPLAGSKRPRD
ncbi:kinase-like protein [Xylona heveae TC161]|uniref:Kinase-like protein n=1 Tax=Xylona heveae (strain CBS 132557 / TC161) TaxID=1328760 RepID=A0A165HA26_XYLHT|nr:kinase-like protein [Xylona heveae TC161]KZF23198.1 kinase-like protein [Xylona heveae TC161]